MRSDLASFRESSSGSDHVGLQEDTFKEDVIVMEGLEDSSINFLGSLKADINAVVTITKNFGFNNGNKTVGLADSGISGKTPSIFLDSNIRWAAISTDLENSSPFGESNTDIIEFLSSLGKIVKAESGGFVFSSWDDSSSFVNLS